MLWAALLHDIKKRGRHDFVGCDHTHPFNGGLAVLKLFHEMGFLKRESTYRQEDLDSACELISKSKQPYSKAKPGSCPEIHSHEFLEPLFTTLWGGRVLVRDGFSDLVFRMVFFH